MFGDPGPLTFEVLNNENQHHVTWHADAQDFKPAGWRMLLYALPTTFELGDVIIHEGDSEHPHAPIPPRTYYGFAFVTNPNGTPRYVRKWESPAPTVVLGAR